MCLTRIYMQARGRGGGGGRGRDRGFDSLAMTAARKNTWQSHLQG